MASECELVLGALCRRGAEVQVQRVGPDAAERRMRMKNQRYELAERRIRRPSLWHETAATVWDRGSTELDFKDTLIPKGLLCEYCKEPWRAIERKRESKRERERERERDREREKDEKADKKRKTRSQRGGRAGNGAIRPEHERGITVAVH
ncbi:hypothetical protein AOLI_G00216650 [Acnodon oligacanthus]